MFIADENGQWRYVLGRHVLSPQPSWECLHFRKYDFSDGGHDLIGSHDGPYFTGTYEFDRVGSVASAYVDVGAGRVPVGSVDDPRLYGTRMGRVLCSAGRPPGSAAPGHGCVRQRPYFLASRLRSSSHWLLVMTPSSWASFRKSSKAFTSSFLSPPSSFRLT